jgi:ribosomal protein L13
MMNIEVVNEMEVVIINGKDKWFIGARKEDSSTYHHQKYQGGKLRKSESSHCVL